MGFGHQEQSESDFEKDRLRDQLVELKEQNEKMEGLVNFLEQEKIRLQDKMEKMMAAGKQQFGIPELTKPNIHQVFLMCH